MEQNTVMNAIYEEANKFGFGMSIEEMATRIYRMPNAKGYDVYTIKERYICCNYQLLKTRSKGCWTVKEF